MEYRLVDTWLPMVIFNFACTKFYYLCCLELLAIMNRRLTKVLYLYENEKQINGNILGSKNVKKAKRNKSTCIVIVYWDTLQTNRSCSRHLLPHTVTVYYKHFHTNYTLI